jgi:uncharacterized protein YbgA (DUF1722 family)/uncharacterized protein YbbK (DUF523 family)
LKIGLSLCLLGNNCRYDGKGARDKFIVEKLGNYFDFVGFCPEDKIFGSPRDTIRLVEMEDEQIQVHIGKNGQDVTEKLVQSSKEDALKAKEENLCGFILKSKSPTCGMARVKVYKPINAPAENKGVGVFANELRKVYPYLPIEEEGRLTDPWLKENFLMQVFAYKHIHEFLDSNPKIKDLVEFHTSYKYLIYAKSQESYKQLGSLVANQDKLPLEEILEAYKLGFLQAIDKKGTRNKTYNVLLHIFGYFKKDILKEEKEHILTACEEYKDGIIPLIAVIKIINLYVKRFHQEYLAKQKFLNPYPKEFSLRSDLRAYK